MKCGICKAETEEKTVTYTEDIDQRVIVVRYVPAHVCTECGNTWYDGTVVAVLERLIDSYLSLAASEISIVNFSRLAA